MKMSKSGWGAGMLGLALVLAGAAAGAEPQAGHGAVFAKDLSSRTVLIGETTLHVPSDTVIVGLNGTRITLAELPVMPTVSGGLFVMSHDAIVRWEADEGAGGLRARRIEVTGEVRK